MKRATKENIEKIKRSVKWAVKKHGVVDGFYVIAGSCTVYAGTDQERTFTEGQLKEIFKAAMEG